MSDSWTNEERGQQRQSDHDLLTQIDTKLSILLSSFRAHIEDDKEIFKSHDGRLKKLEGLVWVVTGIIVTLQIIIKLL